VSTIRIGRIAGIDILVHWSWFAIVFLLTWWLATGFFEEAYPDWSGTEAWAVSVITVVLFFASILVHELSHSIVAKRLGLPVKNITLFIFGGVSSLGEEPRTAREEFQVAIVGPLTSFAIGIVCGILTAVAYAMGEENSPPAGVVAYLLVVNIAVGIFNLLPGFPLDGGRVLRSALWARSKNMLTATRWASNAGRVISIGLMGVGVISVLLGSFVGGIWFIVIGWFLRNASESSYQQLVMRRGLQGTRVGEIVNRSYQAAPPDISLEELVRDYILARSQRCVPVVVGSELIGIVTMSDLTSFPQEQWPSTSVFRAMTPREKVHEVSPTDDLTRALEIMATHDVHQLPVVESREFLGFVTRADVLRLIQIRSELGDRGGDGAMPQPPEPQSERSGVDGLATAPGERTQPHE
jgi:Zn-dependent protease/CBS domain-containing protein